MNRVISLVSISMLLCLGAFAQSTDMPDKAKPIVKKDKSGKIIVEEGRGLLETRYQDNIKRELLKILPKDKFIVTVIAELEPIEEMIIDYNQNKEIETLPGVPSDVMPEDSKPTENALITMLKSLNVIVVVDPKIESSKDALIQSIVSAKAGINEARGDKVTIQRSIIPINNYEEAGTKTSLTNMDSATKITLITVIVLAFIIAVFLIWQLITVKAELKVRPKITADIQIDSNAATKSTGAVQAVTTTASGTDASAENNESNSNKDSSSTSHHEENNKKDHKKKVDGKRNMADYRDKIITFGVTNPKACSTAMRNLLTTPEGTMKASVVVEEIGFDLSKQLFAGVKEQKWKELGRYIKDNIESFDPFMANDIMAEFYRLVMGEVIGMGNELASGTPFDFLEGLNDYVLKRLIENESNTNVALIASYFESPQMIEIINNLSDDRQKEVILEIARFENLPKEAVNQAAQMLAEKIKKLHDPNTIIFNGNEYIGNLLSYVTPEKEEQILSFIEHADPKVRDNLRKYHFSFDDIKNVPEKYLSLVLEAWEPSFIARALIGASSAVVEVFKRSLPPKKVIMLTDELENQDMIGKKETISNRTKILNSIKSTLDQYNINFATLKGENSESKKSEAAFADSDPTVDKTKVA